MGHSVSYVRILEIKRQIASSICEQAGGDGMVCPRQLRHSLFTISALDNLDHISSSTTAKDSFHGTGISLFQFLSKLNTGSPKVSVDLLTTARCNQLPESYNTVPAVVLKKESYIVTDVSVPDSSVTASGHLKEAMVTEHTWLEPAINLIAQDDAEKGEHSLGCLSCCSNSAVPNVTQLMPLFYEKAATAAVMKHGMTVQQKAIQFLP